MVYVDDIVITGNYITRISQLKKHLFSLLDQIFGLSKIFVWY